MSNKTICDVNKPFGVIYLLTNSTNGKVYVGKTNDYKRRMGEYKCHHCKNQYKLYNALVDTGWKKFTHKIIEKVDDLETLNLLERYYIKFYDCYGTDKGYNLTEGGDGGTMSEETKKKLSEINKGEKHTEETKAKIGKAHKGKIVSEETLERMRHCREGWKMPEEGKKKISEAGKKRRHSDETKAKMSLSQKKRFALQKKELNKSEHNLDYFSANELETIAENMKKAIEQEETLSSITPSTLAFSQAEQLQLAI